MWPPRDLVRANMPKQFKEKYPTTRVIIDVTEIFITQPSLLKLQQITFSNYKNHNTFKVLVKWRNYFCVKTFSGLNIRQRINKTKWITSFAGKRWADRGFDIEDLIVRGVRLNIPPFLRRRDNLKMNL